ncbi:hypothetical protein TWF506_006063 [Arthrobotrys conoides]|uniref:BZIP domain-containing protein n=1 Tax=Arthrobotrys conoides TaxID=74498 RepID=A0AAN8S078_9PEZI
MSNIAGEIPAGIITASQPARKPRKLTEKRRAQNREAQRLFRERKRKKVFAALRQSTDPEYWNNPSNLTLDIPIAVNTGIVEPPVDIRAHNLGPRFEPPARVNHERAINEAARQLYNSDVDYAREKQAGRNSSAPRLISLHWLLNDPDEPAPTPDTIPGVYNRFPTTTSSNSNTSNIVESRAESRTDVHKGESSTRLEHLPSIGVRDSPFIPPPDPADDVIELQRPHSLTRPADLLAPTPVERASGGYSLKDIIEAGLEALAAKDQQLDIRLSRSQRIRDREQREQSIEDISTKALEELLIYTPSPCRTHMNLHEITTFKAVVINAKIIGFWNPMPEDFKDPYKSPFVQAYFMNDQSVEKVQEKYTNISESLKPSALQCRTPHKAYIDVFPFPGFRERIIEAGSKGLLNEIEFCADLGKSALMCWGTEQGKHGGEPWNPKSWEAQPWFIKKWDAFIDDELRECSRFWRELRDGGREKPDGQDGQGSSFTPTILLS